MPIVLKQPAKTSMHSVNLFHVFEALLRILGIITSCSYNFLPLIRSEAAVVLEVEIILISKLFTCFTLSSMHHS